jgi:endogenous inhibitor of DNA gyrase (YacG/DUF329 family)
MAALCPICKRAIPDGAYEPPFPFCSQRCKLVDLDGWLTGKYVVSEEMPFDETEGLPPAEDE